MRYNIAKIHKKRTYTPSEAADLLDCTRHTINIWIKKGLQLLDPKQKPRLILGSHLTEYIVAMRQEKKVKLKENEFYCLCCRAAVSAKRGTTTEESTGKYIGKPKRLQYAKRAICRHCNSNVCRFV